MKVNVRDSDLMRFGNKLDIPEDLDTDDIEPCWAWAGAKHGQGRGYGKFRLTVTWQDEEGQEVSGSKMVSAHKASYLLFVGPVADGQVIGHKCNNECCVSPHHLVAQTQSDNMTYCVESGRHASQK